MIVYLLCYLAAALFARTQCCLLSETTLLFAALVLFWRERRRNDGRVNLLAPPPLFSVGGEGISRLKLSCLQDPQELQTFAAFFLVYGAFRLAFLFNGGRERDSRKVRKGRLTEVRAGRLFAAVVGLTALSATIFLAEVRILGLASFLVWHMPRAYFYFHVSGLHYLTVSCALVPSLALLYINVVYHRSTVTNLGLLAAVAASLLIPMLCVSRFQLPLAVLMTALTWLNFRRESIPAPLAGFGLVCLLGVYGIPSMARGHSVSYLNGVLRMKWDSPVPVSQPYICIAGNYDSVNCLIRELPSHSFGFKALSPFFVLTELKFLWSEFVDFPIYMIKTEFTTVTLIYDAWYDFGILGVVLFMALLGFIAARFEKKLCSVHSPVSYMLYVQLAIYLMLSFFTTWSSNPATWMYLGETTFVLWFVGEKRQWK